MHKPPLYTHAYRFAELTFQATASFPKHLRPVLGRRIEEHALDLLGKTQRALFDKHTVLLKESLVLVDHLKLLLQLSHDIKAISHHHFAQMTETQMQIGRMLQGLLAYREKKSDPRPQAKESPPCC